MTIFDTDSEDFALKEHETLPQEHKTQLGELYGSSSLVWKTLVGLTFLILALACQKTQAKLIFVQK